MVKVTEVDVMTRVYCDLATAIKGGKVQVAGLDGPMYNVTIPAGTQSKTKFNISNKGLWQDTNCNIRGSLIAELNIAISPMISPNSQDGQVVSVSLSDD